MASVSPALHASQPAGSFDIKRPAEYAIVLGDSLRHSNTADQFLNLRYNWQAKSGISTSRTTLKSTKDGFRLSIKGREGASDSSFTYTGHDRPSPGDTVQDQHTFALIFDRNDSIFKLEAVVESIDLNLESTTSKLVDPDKLPKLAKVAANQKGLDVNGDHESLDDEAPDINNPFDFRNFLAEARENADKAVQVNGGKTSLAGSRTPVSGFASPVPGTTRFKPATPNFTPTSSPAPKKRRTDEGTKHSKLASPMRQKPALKKRKPVEERRVPLSKDRISDSDDELSDTIEVQNTSTPLQSHSKGHKRNVSGGFSRSPHIMVNDGDLEIDMGSPPHEARGRPRGRIDPGAFRSHTGTPVMGTSANRRLPSEDVQMTEPEHYHSEDGDIEELELGSPRASRLSVHGSRSASIIEPRSGSMQEHAPTPPNQAGDDEDDLLAAEFEAALEEEEKGADSTDRGQGYGLGITGASQRLDDDDESEVSEEE